MFFVPENRHYNQHNNQNDALKNVITSFRNLKSFKEYSTEELVSAAEKAAKALHVNSSNLRKFHGEISKQWENYRTSKEFDINQIILMKPLLAYMAGRDRKLKDFSELITVAIEKIKDAKDFEKFKQFYDSLIAYHRYFGG